MVTRAVTPYLITSAIRLYRRENFFESCFMQQLKGFHLNFLMHIFVPQYSYSKKPINRLMHDCTFYEASAIPICLCSSFPNSRWFRGFLNRKDEVWRSETLAEPPAQRWMEIHVEINSFLMNFSAKWRLLICTFYLAEKRHVSLRDALVQNLGFQIKRLRFWMKNIMKNSRH